MAIYLHPTPCPCPVHGGQDREASPGLTHREGEPCPVRDEFLSTRNSDPCCCVFQADMARLALLGFCDPKLATELLADKTAEQAAEFGNRLVEAADELEIRHARLGGQIRVEFGRLLRFDSDGPVTWTKPISLAEASEEVRFAGGWYLSVAVLGFGVRVEDRSEVEG